METSKQRVDLTMLCQQGVVSSGGEKLGNVDQVVVTVPEGRIDYVIVELNGPTAAGGPRRVAIPWSQFKLSDGGDALELDISMKILRAVARNHAVRGGG